MRWAALKHRRALGALVVIAALLVAGRLALNPFVARHTRDVLDSLKDYRGSFDSVSVSLYKLSYTIDGLKLVQTPTPPGGSEKRPFFYARRIEIGLHWRGPIHKNQLVGNAGLDQPKKKQIPRPPQGENPTQ